MRELAAALAKEEAVLREGGGKSGHERQRRLGRLPVRERLDKLFDPGSGSFEIGLWAAHGMYKEWGSVPAAGVVTAIGKVNGRACLAVANDATVKAGAFFPQTAKKVLRAQRVAAACSLPLLYLVDSAGVFLPMQDEVFPDEDDFGRVFRNNAVLSSLGLPQFAAIMGNCVAGGAYLPILCDKVLMTEGSELYLAGPALVKAAINQTVPAEELGGATMHAGLAGTVDFHEPNDPACLDRLRRLVGLLPADPTPDILGQPHQPDAAPWLDKLSPEGRKEYDVRDLLTAWCDDGQIDEYKAAYGPTLVCAYGRLGGRPVGIVANQRKRVTTAAGQLQLGGVIYADSAEKAARFILDCDQTGVPLLFVQDVQGFMVGRDAEQSGIIRRGAKLVSAMSNATVPKVTLITGGAFGAGHYVMCGKAFDPTFILAWPNARYAVMGAEQAAGTLLQVQESAAKRAGKELSPDDLAALRERVRQSYLEQMDIRYAGARGWVDAIIDPAATRAVLTDCLALAGRKPPRPAGRLGVFQV